MQSGGPAGFASPPTPRREQRTQEYMAMPSMPRSPLGVSGAFSSSGTIPMSGPQEGGGFAAPVFTTISATSSAPSSSSQHAPPRPARLGAPPGTFSVHPAAKPPTDVYRSIQVASPPPPSDVYVGIHANSSSSSASASASSSFPAPAGPEDDTGKAYTRIPPASAFNSSSAGAKRDNNKPQFVSFSAAEDSLQYTATMDASRGAPPSPSMTFASSSSSSPPSSASDSPAWRPRHPSLPPGSLLSPVLSPRSGQSAGAIPTDSPDKRRSFLSIGEQRSHTAIAFSTLGSFIGNISGQNATVAPDALSLAVSRTNSAPAEPHENALAHDAPATFAPASAPTSVHAFPRVCAPAPPSSAPPSPSLKSSGGSAASSSPSMSPNSSAGSVPKPQPPSPSLSVSSGTIPSTKQAASPRLASASAGTIPTARPAPSPADPPSPALAPVTSPKPTPRAAPPPQVISSVRGATYGTGEKTMPSFTPSSASSIPSSTAAPSSLTSSGGAPNNDVTKLSCYHGNITRDASVQALLQFFQSRKQDCYLLRKSSQHKGDPNDCFALSVVQQGNVFHFIVSREPSKGLKIQDCMDDASIHPDLQHLLTASPLLRGAAPVPVAR